VGVGEGEGEGGEGRRRILNQNNANPHPHMLEIDTYPDRPVPPLDVDHDPEQQHWPLEGVVRDYKDIFVTEMATVN
jgi:hypothetical protein